MTDNQQTQLSLNQKHAKKFQWLNFFFVIVVISQVVGQLFKITCLQLLKPLPIILIIFNIYRKNSERGHIVPKLINIGLVICLVGDVLLMFKEIYYFNIGTGFFMVGHTFYIVAFSIGKPVRQLNDKLKLPRKIANVILIFLVLLNLFMLWDKVPLRWLYSFYGLILGIQGIVTLSRYEITSKDSFNLTLYGVLLFAISDNLLGFLKFNHIHTNVGRCVIMLTYYGAQFFIMQGALEQSNHQNEVDKSVNAAKSKAN